MTFFVSTSLWVYAEPILSIYLKDEYQIADWAAPLFFLVFSLGYLVASFVMFLTNISKKPAYKLSSTAFVITGLCHVLLIVKIKNHILQLVCVGLGLFLVSFFSTFTLVPIY